MAISVVVVLVAGVVYEFVLAALGNRLKKLVAHAASIAITAPNLKNTILNRPQSLISQNLCHSFGVVSIYFPYLIVLVKCTSLYRNRAIQVGAN